MTSKAAPAAPEPPADPGRLFSGLAGRRGLILAVSGGPDSTALMLLAARWAERPPSLVVSIDHGLRADSADDAALAVANASALGLPGRVIRVSLAAGGNLQDRARRARYAALAQGARDAGFDTIVTAHHRDDQAETFLLRLARGSGVYGLSAMRGEGMAGDIALARPLLGLARADLARIVAASDLATADDPSNADSRFDRARLRAAMPALTNIGLGAEKLAETAARLGRAADALDHYAGVLLADHFTADAYGSVSGDAAALVAAPAEVALRALARLLQAVGGADYTPPFAALEAALAGIGPRHRFRRTLAGVVLEQNGGHLSAIRELGRTGLGWLRVRGGETLDWDRRFHIEVPATGEQLRIGALAGADSRLRARGVSRAVLQTLPGLYSGDTLVAAPAGVLTADLGIALKPLPVRCLVGSRLGIAAAAANQPP